LPLVRRPVHPDNRISSLIIDYLGMYRNEGAHQT
jgi:hypothetical protein